MHNISGNEIIKIFNEQIWGDLFQHYLPSNYPEIFFIGGQPATGKTSILLDLKRLNPKTIAPIEGDKFRTYHPNYYLMKTQPFNMVEYTSHSSARWVELSHEKLRNNRISCALETTMRQPQIVMETALQFQKAGYKVNFHVILANKKLTWSRCLLRRERFLAEAGITRLVKKETHDSAYENVPKCLELLYLIENINLVFHNSASEIISEFQSINLEALMFLGKFRIQDTDQNNYSEIIENIQQTKHLLYKRNANAEYFKEVEKALKGLGR